MTFEQAKEELKKMAGENYCCINYEYSFYTSGLAEGSCVLYIDLGYEGEGDRDGRIRVSSLNWDDSVTAMRVRLG